MERQASDDHAALLGYQDQAHRLGQPVCEALAYLGASGWVTQLGEQGSQLMRVAGFGVADEEVGVAAHGLLVCRNSLTQHRQLAHAAREAASTRVLTSQLTACFTSALILASAAAVNSVRANATGHTEPSSRFALSLKPSVAYRVLNFCAGWKWQTSLPSLA